MASWAAVVAAKPTQIRAVVFMLCVSWVGCAVWGAGFGRWVSYHGVKRLGRKSLGNLGAVSMTTLVVILHEERSDESSGA